MIAGNDRRVEKDRSEREIRNNRGKESKSSLDNPRDAFVDVCKAILRWRPGDIGQPDISVFYADESFARTFHYDATKFGNEEEQVLFRRFCPEAIDGYSEIYCQVYESMLQCVPMTQWMSLLRSDQVILNCHVTLTHITPPARPDYSNERPTTSYIDPISTAKVASNYSTSSVLHSGHQEASSYSASEVELLDESMIDDFINHWLADDQVAVRPEEPKNVDGNEFGKSLRSPLQFEDRAAAQVDVSSTIAEPSSLSTTSTSDGAVFVRKAKYACLSVRNGQLVGNVMSFNHGLFMG
jgi:hypothetical protein